MIMTWNALNDDWGSPAAENPPQFGRLRAILPPSNRIARADAELHIVACGRRFQTYAMGVSIAMNGLMIWIWSRMRICF